MRAVRFDSYGDRDVLHVEDVEVPEPAAGRAVVQVVAAGINPGEAAIRTGALHGRYPATFPTGQGTDLAGVVTAVGDGVRDLQVGDEVLGWSWERSSHAEYVSVPVEQLVPKPAGCSWLAAGSLNVAGATAWAAVEAVGAGTGDVVVVSAAAGGVGSAVVQLLTLRGATVIGIASEANHAWLRERGAIPVAYGNGLADRIRAAVDGRIDAFIDLFGPQYIDLAVELGVSPERIETIISFERAGEIGAKAEGSQQGSRPEVMSELAELIAAGTLEWPVAATYGLEEVVDAFAELEDRHVHGKIVLGMDPERVDAAH